ncbi:MAG: radical SAM protein [Bacteroidetes bacterium]|nr:radical SAM protein [Bacteroidota bacterium]
MFCNQRNISGQLKVPSEKEIIETIEKYLSTINSENSFTEVAFFGGSFTGLPLNEQERFLKTVQPFIKSGVIKSIRVSTRPDYINKEILNLLKVYGVKTIELGAQSMDEEVLKLSGRGHNVEDVINASGLIKAEGFSLGLQMMIGLPGDTLEKAIITAKQIIALGADNTRIYPALVIKDTELENLYLENNYNPLTLEEAVYRAKEVFKIFEKSNVKVLRMGLHPSEGLISGDSLVAGPFHVSFGELVFTALWAEALSPLLKTRNAKSITISVPKKQLNFAIGYNASNKKMLLQHFKNVNFVSDTSLTGRNYSVNS